MLIQALTLSDGDVRRLLSAASPDGALLYLYLQSGNPLENAEADLKLNPQRIQCATATLRQLGLYTDQRRSAIAPGERPNYTELDVIAMEKDTDFQRLYGEVQRLLGRTLTIEELKILIGFVNYLGMSAELISLLICYCRERSRQKGRLRAPSLRSIEKEAYAWAEQGIDTVEDASVYIHAQNVRHSRLHRLMQLLQIRGRNLTAAEERYAQSWLDMGFDEQSLSMAYERTCLNTGGLNWAYMNKILQCWHQQGLHTAQDIQSKDHKTGVPKGASGELGAAELEAIASVLQEG